MTGTLYQDALDAVHAHCDQCTNCYQARRDGTWPTVACSAGKRLRKAAAAAWQPTEALR